MGDSGEHGNEVGNSVPPGEYVTGADFDRFTSRMEAALLTVLTSRQEVTTTSPLQAILPAEDTPGKQSGKQHVVEEGRPGHPPYYPVSVAGVRFSEETEARLAGGRQVGGIRAMSDLAGPSCLGFEVGEPSRSMDDVIPLTYDLGEYVRDSRQVADRRTSGSRSPFCREILEAPVPEEFREPVLCYYSGKDDPLSHI